MIFGDENYDTNLGEVAGTGCIFGTTAGVIEAENYSVSYLLDKTEIVNVKFKNVRGFKGIKDGKIVYII